MRQLSKVTLSLALAAATLCAQQPVGMRSVAWTNLSGAGSSVLAADVLYPSAYNGANAPFAQPPSSNGFPVVVCLHGYGLIGRDYGNIGTRLAESGYVAVMLNTARWSYGTLESDTRAVFKVLGFETQNAGGSFTSKFDMQRVGLIGHSMGAAVMAYVLSDNPGYSCGLGLAPVNPTLIKPVSTISVPVGLVSGEGDTLTPPSTHAVPFYNAFTPSQGLKFHYQMTDACDHMNIAGLHAQEPEVFSRVKRIIHGFFGQFMGSAIPGLEPVLGDDGLSDRNLISVDVETSVPQVWSDSPLRIGHTARLSIVLEGGWGGMIGASSFGPPQSTMLGTLLLDENSAFTLEECPVVGQRLDVSLTVPSIPALVGSTFAVQGAGSSVCSPFTLGSALGFEIGS